MPRIKWDINLLESLAKKLGFVLVDGYKDQKIHAHARIKGKCKTEGCPNEFDAKFQYLFNSENCFCKSCIAIFSVKKRKDTVKKIYNVDDINDIPGVKDKRIRTNIAKFGCENVGQNEDIKKKIKDTNIASFGVSCSMKNEDVKRKHKLNFNNKYGVDNPMQIPKFAEKQLKSAFSLKEYKTTSGKIFYVQGFEPFAIKKLIEDDLIDEDDIITARTDVPNVWYIDCDGIKHRHYIDIYIKSQNKMIEVKSEWTIKKVKESNIFEKQKAAKSLGYNYEIWVFARNGELSEVYH